jgi:hypothetical protein
MRLEVSFCSTPDEPKRESFLLCPVMPLVGSLEVTPGVGSGGLLGHFGQWIAICSRAMRGDKGREMGRRKGRRRFLTALEYCLRWTGVFELALGFLY